MCSMYFFSCGSLEYKNSNSASRSLICFQESIISCFLDSSLLRALRVCFFIFCSNNNFDFVLKFNENIPNLCWYIHAKHNHPKVLLRLLLGHPMQFENNTLAFHLLR